MINDEQNKRTLANLRTEQRNPGSCGIGSKSVRKILEKINDFDQTVAPAVRLAIPEIEQATEVIVERLRKGGRLVYIGAGTSGRLGFMDAAEIMPTYGLDSVICVMAGGRDAVFQPNELLEDERTMAKRDLQAISLSPKDAVVAAAASGRTPYCIGGLEYAKEVGAGRIALSCNKNAVLSTYAEVGIEVDTGEEFVMGSTRMKAGTAQKLVMNMLSTTAMIQLGRTYDNLMIRINCQNQKGLNRGVRLFQEAVGTDDMEYTRHMISDAEGDIAIAVLCALTGAEPDKARETLARQQGSFPKALQALGKGEAS